MVKLDQANSIGGYKIFTFQLYRASNTTGTSYTEYTINHNLNAHPFMAMFYNSAWSTVTGLYLDPDLRMASGTSHLRGWFVYQATSNSCKFRLYRTPLTGGYFKVALFFIDAYIVSIV